MIDIGVNLTSNRFDKDRAQVIERARQANIVKMLITGTNVQESEAALTLAKQFPSFLYATAGVHPHDAARVSADYIEQLTSLAQHQQVRAIGECGLDFNRNFSPPEQQISVFEQQIALANQLNLPLFLHQRDAFETWRELLLPYIDKVPAMVSHCFTDDKLLLKQVVDMGMFVGITGWLCDDRRGQALQEAVNYLPLDRLMIETDAPYLTPRTIRPKPKSSRNEPAYLIHVVQRLAQIKNVSEEDIITASTMNAQRVFGLGETQ